jgi:hypothetical protein
MATVNISGVGAVNFPDNMPHSEIQKHSARLSAIHNISRRTGSIDVTRSLPFAKKLVEKGNAPPEVRHFVSSAQHAPDGREHVDFASGRHALISAGVVGGNDLVRSEFTKTLGEDLREGTGRLQGRNSQGALPPIFFLYVHSSRRQRSIRSTMNPAMKIDQPIFYPGLVLLPGDPVHSGCGFLLQ